MVERVIPIGVIRELEVLFNGAAYAAADRLAPEKAPEIFVVSLKI